MYMTIIVSEFIMKLKSIIKLGSLSSSELPLFQRKKYGKK